MILSMYVYALIIISLSHSVRYHISANTLLIVCILKEKKETHFKNTDEEFSMAFKLKIKKRIITMTYRLSKKKNVHVRTKMYSIVTDVCKFVNMSHKYAIIWFNNRSVMKKSII